MQPDEIQEEWKVGFFLVRGIGDVPAGFVWRIISWFIVGDDSNFKTLDGIGKFLVMNIRNELKIRAT